MAEYLVVSDSHGVYLWVRKALEEHPQAAGILFLGDGLRDMERLRRDGCTLPMYLVRGNCDSVLACPKEMILELEGVPVLLCHGHCYGVKVSLADLAAHAAQKQVRITFFGHTHLPTVEEHQGVTLFNPGSIGAPRFGGPSYGVFTVHPDGSAELHHQEGECAF